MSAICTQVVSSSRIIKLLQCNDIRMAFASASGSFGGINSPFASCFTLYGNSPTADAITGFPLAHASLATREKVST